MIIAVALSAALFVRLWVPLMDTKEQKVKIGVAAAAGLIAISVGGVMKFGLPLKTALAYYAVIIVSFAIGALGHSASIRAVATREAAEGPSKENQMSGLLIIQIFAVMVALFFLGGWLFEDF
ncbi:hypothetical protein [Streptomyces sp. NPDC059092]|uniref:hypothetical protein n=1 Tax=Streptomyces sp. NPDC059092 TaxID=3346725 RepID=UPI0036B39E08